MDHRQSRAREIQRLIGDVLLRHWDPLGVAGEEDAPSGEYNAYVGSVYRLLVSGASVPEIAEYLATVESQILGLPDANPHTLIPLAEQLCRLNVRLRSDDRAM